MTLDQIDGIEPIHDNWNSVLGDEIDEVNDIIFRMSCSDALLIRYFCRLEILRECGIRPWSDQDVPLQDPLEMDAAKQLAFVR